MKKFQFKLDALVRYREHMEQLARQELAQAEREVSESESRMEGMRSDQAAREGDFASEATRGLSADRLRLYSDYLAGLELDLAQEEKRREALVKTRSEKRDNLADRSKERKLLVNLRERQKDAYYKEMFAEEQKLVDDMTVLRKARDINK